MGGMGRQAKHHNAVIFSELDGFWFEVGAVVEDGQPRHDSRNVWSSKSGTNLDLSNHYRSLHTSFRHFILHSQVVELLCSENDVWWNRLTSCISTAYDSYLRPFCPEHLYRTFFYPFEATTLGGRESKGIPVSSML